MSRIHEYLPETLKDVIDLKLLNEDLDIELEQLDGYITGIGKEVIIETASLYGIEKWENALGITPKDGDSLETRRFRVNNLLTSKLPYTYRWLIKKLTQITGSPSGYTLNINQNDYAITIVLSGLDTNMMIDSEREMVSILKKSSLLEDKEKNQLDDLLNSLIRIHIKQLDNIYVSFQVKKWLENVRIESLKKKIGDRVGIYGAADIGTALFEGIIRIFDAEVIFIDRNAKYISKDVEVYTPDNFPQNLDSIIIAVNDHSIVLNIKEFLTIHTDATIFELGELINNIETK